jgi:tRNA pseudouridine38-40 synthase
MSDFSPTSRGSIKPISLACFTAFKTSVREIYSVELSKGPLGVHFIDISADGFLKYMVRNIVGTLVDVGRGKIPPGELEGIIESRDRKRAGQTAPACGLFLIRVYYRED